MFLVALGPLSRVGDPGAGTAGPGGIALLAPDSVRYLAGSATWAEIGGAAWTRWGYLAVLRVGHLLLGDAATFAVTVQALVSATVGVRLLRTGRRLAGPVAGRVAAAVLLLNPMTAQWTRFVLTESLFYALAVMTVLIAADDLRPDDRGATSRRLLRLAAAAAVFRPTGPLLAGSALTLALRHPGDSRRNGSAIVLVWVAVAAAMALGSVATGPPTEGTFAEQLRGGVVVEGTPEVRTTIRMPDHPGGDLTSYVVAHPLPTLRLAAARVVVEVAQVRRHYPTVVNLGLGSAMVLLLALAVVGLRDPRGRKLRIPTATVLVPLVSIVAATFAVPEGRYGWAGLIALAPAVGVGAEVLTERLRRQSIGGMER